MAGTDPIKLTSKREKQRQILIDEAEKIIDAGGLGQIKARTLAARVGIALGQIYNLFEDLDRIIIAVNSRTIARLEDSLLQQTAPVFSSLSEAETALKLKGASEIATDALIAAALAYHHFARDNYHLWHALFDYQPTARQKTTLEQISDERLRPFRLIERLLSSLCPTMSVEELHIFAQTLFSSVHGIILIALDARDVGVPKEQIDDQLRFHLSLICCGLKNRFSGG